MFADRVALIALSTLSLVSAQANSNSTFTIDPDEVTPLEHSNWCTAQTNSCNTLCGTVLQNNCDLFVCTKLQDNCIEANVGNANGQKNCTATYGDKCGTEDVNDHKGEGAATVTTSSSATAEPTSTESSTASSLTSSSMDGAAPTAHAQFIGNGAAAVALGLLAYAL
ncbi:hypothetical protein NPX13_g1590 [Xylaria arbuscula]|uniref:DUF7707 domain-containing protein n=1 Tax=Xylaria arbuscula TaxID=114810 RepID=A0A9W8NLR9_9PEZI|nr:hypothetical protein NPX13_g1590 [Xylaria arbuscula]